MLYHSGYLLYIVPVVMFTVSDTVAFMSLSRLNPATFSLIWNCKTAFVAVLFRFFIKGQPMAWHKWLGVALLLLGPGRAEAGNLWHAGQTLVGGGLYELNPVAVYKLNPPVAVYKLNPGAVCTS